MGKTITNSTHAATLLRNVPESWRLITQTIQVITNNPDDIGERLEAHKADLNAIEISSQAATAFTARSNQFKCPIPNTPVPAPTSTSNQAVNPTLKDNPSRPFYYCNNCG